MTNGNATTWTDLKTLLIRHHGENTSIDVLVDKIRTCRCDSTIANFYLKLNNLLCRLNNAYLLDGRGTNAEIESNRRIVLQAFKSGLPEPVRSVIISRNPTSLTDAYEILRSNGYLNYTNSPKNRNPDKQNFKQFNNRNNNNTNNNNRNNNTNNNNQNNNTNNNNNDRNNGNASNSYNNQRQNSNHNNQNQPLQTRQSSANSNQSRFSQNSRNRSQHNNYNNAQPNRNSANNNDAPEPMDVSMNEDEAQENFQLDSQRNYPI